LVARLRTALVGACFVALLVAAPSAHAAFPGANGKIAFASTRDLSNPTRCFECPSQIYTINPDGSGEINITHNPANNDAPAWSPDGLRIAFLSNRDGNNEIYTMKADGSSVTRLTNDPAQDDYPSWSPDGSKIVFRSNRPPGCGIYVMNADGSGVTRVTSLDPSCTGRADSGSPVWSPDGTEIAFYDMNPAYASFYSWPPYFLYKVKADGTGLTYLANDGVNPDWSPDSAHIVFEDADSGRLFIMNRDGSGSTGIPITNGIDPAWSPDGQRIARVSYANAVFDIYTSNPDGGGNSQVTNDNARDMLPNWQPIPNRSPDCSNVTATPGTLWPLNHKLVPVSLSGASDPDGDPVTLTLTGVTQDEPTRHSPDATLGPASNQVKLRAKRSSHGDGRVYRIAFKATDGRGGECSGAATVGVPRRKNRPPIDSAPPSYDSLVGTPGGGGQDGGDQHGRQG
jgi:TolB protein